MQKHPFGCFFAVFRFGTVLFLVLRRFPRVTRRGSSSGGGQICQNAEIPPSFMSLPIFSVNACIYSTLRPFLCQHLGALPKPSHLRGRRGRWQNLTHLPLRWCWVASKASRVKCTASPPLTPFQLCENSQTIRSGRSRKPVKACEATACGLAFTGWRRPNALW